MTIDPKAVPLVLLEFQAALPAAIKPAAFDTLVSFVALTVTTRPSADTVLISTQDLDVVEVAILSKPIEDVPVPTCATDAPAALAPSHDSDVAAPKANPDRSETGKSWSLEELQQARDLANAGKGAPEIARIIGRSTAATYMAIKRYGVIGTDPITVPGPRLPFGKLKAALAPKPVTVPDAIKKQRPAKAAVSAKKRAKNQKAIKKKSAPQAAPLPKAAPIPKAAPVPKAASVATAAPVPAKRSASALHDAVAEKLTSRQITLVGHLIRLPATFTRADDLYLAEGISQRRPTPEIVDQLGVEAPALIVRWKSMAPPSLSDRSGHLMAEFRDDMLRTLRWLVEWEARTDV